MRNGSVERRQFIRCGIYSTVWTTPVVQSVLLPVHAQTSCIITPPTDPNCIPQAVGEAAFMLGELDASDPISGASVGVTINISGSNSTITFRLSIIGAGFVTAGEAAMNCTSGDYSLSYTSGDYRYDISGLVKNSGGSGNSYNALVQMRVENLLTGDIESDSQDVFLGAACF